MAHIHELIDYVVAAYIVHNGKVLLVHHKQLKQWLPVGGHIELHEDSDQALLREIEEECGLDRSHLTFIDNRPDGKYETKFLMAPQHVDIHEFNESHRHLCMSYFARSITGDIRHNAAEHNSIKWFSEEELDGKNIPDNVVFLAKEALKVLGSK